MPGAATYTATIEPLPALERLETLWTDLEARCAPPFFLTWHWIGTWLAVSGASPRLALIHEGTDIVALALVGESIQRIGPWSIPRAHLNQAGSPRRGQRLY